MEGSKYVFFFFLTPSPLSVVPFPFYLYALFKKLLYAFLPNCTRFSFDLHALFVFFTCFCSLPDLYSCFLLSRSYSRSFGLLFLPPIDLALPLSLSFLDVIFPLRTTSPFLPSFLTSSNQVSLHSTLLSFGSPSPSALLFIVFPFQHLLILTCISPFGLSFQFFPSLSRSLSSFSTHFFLALSSLHLSFLFLHLRSFPLSSFSFHSSSPSLCYCPNLPIRTIFLLFRICILSPGFLYLFRTRPPFLSLDLCLSRKIFFPLLLCLSLLLSVFRSPSPLFLTFASELNLTHTRNSEHVHESTDGGVLRDVGHRE